MNYYETLYIVHPALESGRLKDIILSVEDMYIKMNSKMLSTDVWGKKKLAYLIDKQKYGTYVLVQFESEGDNINKISTELEINPNVLAYLTTKINELSLQKDMKSLDEQISGFKPSASSLSHAKSTPTEEVVPTKVSKEAAKETAGETAEETSEETSKETSKETSEEAAGETAEETSEEAVEKVSSDKEEVVLDNEKLTNKNEEETHGTN